MINDSTIDSMDNLREPPHNKELEEIVLGTLILESNAYYQVDDVLSVDVFYFREHQCIFRAIQMLASKQAPIDFATVYSQLKKQGEAELAGGIGKIVNLVGLVNSTSHFEYHAQLLSNLAHRRKLIEVGVWIASSGYNDTEEVNAILDNAESRLFQLSRNGSASNTSSLVELLPGVIDKINDRVKRGQIGSITGLTSGFPDIDKKTGGWFAGQLVIIAARPGMGKSAFALSMSRLMAVKHHIPVAFFSLEMTKSELILRLIVGQSEVPNNDVRHGSLTELQTKAIMNCLQLFESAPLYINDTAGISVQDFKGQVRKLARDYSIRLVVVDYIQLMTVSGLKVNANREQEVSTVSRTLKAIANELGIVIVALSQLNRNIENRTAKDRRPQLSDLRESGSLEQDADVVAFIHRPEYYGVTINEDCRDMKGVAEFIISKQRNGPLGSIPLKFIGEYVKFDSIDELPF